MPEIKPSKKICNKVIKLLEQYERLCEKIRSDYNGPVFALRPSTKLRARLLLPCPRSLSLSKGTSSGKSRS